MNHKVFSVRYASLQIDLLSNYKKAVEGCLCNSPSFVLACYHARGQCQGRARGLAQKKRFLLWLKLFFLLFAWFPSGISFSRLLFIPTFIRHIAGSLPRVLWTAWETSRTLQLGTRVSLVIGLNPTSRDTSWRQPCSTCKALYSASPLRGRCALCQGLVRFCALFRIKPHVPPLVQAPANSFEFQCCHRTPQAECLSRLLSPWSKDQRRALIVYGVDYWGI